MTENLSLLAKDYEEEVQLSLDTLQNRLATVEQELDLECLNLRHIVNTQNPDVNRQLDALSNSIKDLHDSLSEVKGHLEKAASDGRELKRAATGPDLSPVSTAGPTNGDPVLSAAEESRLRHDEGITLSGIFRALFMADEPAQRANTPKGGAF